MSKIPSYYCPFIYYLNKTIFSSFISVFENIFIISSNSSLSLFFIYENTLLNTWSNKTVYNEAKIFAQILNNMKKRQESRMRMEALIPYMRLIGKKEMADLVQEYLEKNLTNDVN